MGVQVAFNYQAWTLLFPEFSALSQEQVLAWESVAETYVRNDGGGPVASANVQTNLLNFTTAHLCQIYLGSSTQGASALVGRINSATQGSVSVQAEMQGPPAAAWWNQTKYGTAAWQLLAPYRTMRYMPTIGGCGNGFAGGWPVGFRGFC